MPAKLNPRHAAYVGSFDPVSLGHLDIIRRGARIFERLTIGVGLNPDKRPLFEPEERIALLREVVAPWANVEVVAFHGLSVDFVRRSGAAVLVRGMRTLSDIEAEFTMTLANTALDPEIETVFLMASEKYSHISSTLIKQIAQLGSDQINDQLASFVPQPVIAPLVAKFPARGSGL